MQEMLSAEYLLLDDDEEETLLQKFGDKLPMKLEESKSGWETWADAKG